MTGGPAFPCIVPFPKEGDEIESGMSLRDYFAAKAMERMLPWDSQYPTEALRSRGEENFRKYCDAIATTAFAIADAMLKARGE